MSSLYFALDLFPSFKVSALDFDVVYCTLPQLSEHSGGEVAFSISKNPASIMRTDKT
jgi:hypothetical protein